MVQDSSRTKSDSNISRRRALSLALGGLALAPACRPKDDETPPAPTAAPTLLEGHDLAPASIDPAIEIRTVAGLRPYRRSGFVVRREERNGKLLIHNYGHGGGGFTLSWGCAHLALQQAGSVMGKACAIIGGGVMGLSTARLLLRQGASSVTVYTEALPPDTTSNVAGAQWWPVSVFSPQHRTDAFSAQFVEAAKFSFRYFQDFIGPRWGVRWLPNYYLNEGPPLNGWMGGPGGVLHAMQIGLQDFGPGEHVFPAPHVRRFHTMLIEPAIYLETLMQEIRAAGADVIIRRFSDASEVLQLTEPVIFNCAGLGTKALFDDEELTPIKGQLSILLPQPEVNYNLITDWLYMFPRSTGLLLGGSYERGNWDLTPSESERTRIIQSHVKLFTEMKRRQMATQK